MKFKEVDWSKVMKRPKRPHHEILCEAEAITEHAEKIKAKMRAAAKRAEAKRRQEK